MLSGVDPLESYCTAIRNMLYPSLARLILLLLIYGSEIR